MATGAQSKLKADATFFSIADGIVQHMFIEHLFSGNKFSEIVGEEDETAVNIVTKPYTVDDLVVPEEFNDIIESTLVRVKALAQKIDGEAYKTLTVFVDPIDGTREFATGQGDKVTVLIGYNDAQGLPVAGIMYRPVTSPATWAAGAKSENCVLGMLDLAPAPNPNGVLITDGKVSPFISSLIDAMGYERVPSLASGNRAMMILEGKAGAYLRDTGGFSKWDTSGPQAVFEAYGGTMAKLPTFLRDKSLQSYTYLRAPVNLDFESGAINLSLTNARDKSRVVKGVDTKVSDVNLLKEYSCLCGMVALGSQSMGDLDRLHACAVQVAETHPPTYT